MRPSAVNMLRCKLLQLWYQTIFSMHLQPAAVIDDPCRNAYSAGSSSIVPRSVSSPANTSTSSISASLKSSLAGSTATV